jgi:hypothetical protein
MLYGSCGGGCSMLQFAAATGDHHYYSGKQCGGEGYGSVPYGGSVDCTLSLGTPSTRRAEAGARAPGGMPWEAVSSTCNGGQQVARADHQTTAGGARRCANCDTASTPLWRNGPRGPKVRTSCANSSYGHDTHKCTYIA